MDTEQQIRAIISRQLKVAEEELTPDRRFRSLPGVDSMRVLQIILETENAFDIEIDDEATFRLETVGEFQELVDRLRGERASA
jgi:acyl carrier protein